MTSLEFKEKIPSFVWTAAKELKEHGFKAYLVGGSVRDLYLGRVPFDYDIATDAYPEQVAKIFAKSIPTGAKFGTMVVVLPDENGENFDLEITTFRSEADYFGGRWPAKVEFTKTIEEDLERRDFTVNAMALNLNSDSLDLIDPFGGQVDLAAKVMRAVGDPLARFEEDGLRAMRACRLASNLGFTIDAQTFAAIPTTLTILAQVSVERIRDEFMKLILKSPMPSMGIEHLRKSGILAVIMPELLEGIDVVQPQFHTDDVYSHSLKALDIAEDRIKLAALLHDIGKPRTKTEDDKGVHFYGHDVVGTEMTKEIMQRLKFSNAEIEHTTTLVRWHMFYYPNADWRKQKSLTPVEETSPGEFILTIMRHSQNELALKDEIYGQSTDSLTPQGVAIANEAIIRLKQDIPALDAVVASALPRAKETAEIMAQGYGLNYTFDSRFNERFLGALQGYTWPQFAQEFPELAAMGTHKPLIMEVVPGGETMSSLVSRVKVGLFNLAKHNWGKHVLLVSHLGAIQILKNIFREVNPEEALPVKDLDFCEYFTVKLNIKQIDPQFLSDSELEILRQEQVAEQDNAGGWSDAAVRRFIRNVGGEDVVDDLMRLRIADASANSKAAFNPLEISVLSERIAKVRSQEMALKVKDLKINGEDLKAVGVEPGKEMGSLLNYLLELVIEEPLWNTNEKLLELSRAYLAENLNSRA